MKNIKLDKEEADLLASIENNEWESVPNLEEEIKLHRQYARNTLNRNHQVNSSERVVWADEGSPLINKAVGMI